MSIARDTANLFSPLVRERGRDYFYHRAVTVTRGDAWSVTAFVAGPQQYQVDLTRNNAHHIMARCTCPEFARRELCKHVWATLLAAEKKGLLSGPGGRPQHVTLGGDYDSLATIGPRHDAGDGATIDSMIGGAHNGSHADPAGFGEAADLDGSPWGPPPGADGAGSSPSPASRAAAQAGAAAGQALDAEGPPLPGVPLTWRQQLAALRHGPDEAPGSQFRTSTRQVVYIFDLDASRSTRGVVLHLGWQDLKNDGEWGRVQTRPYLTHELAGTLERDDIEIITLLEGAASSYIRDIELEPPRGVLRNHYHLTQTMLDLLWPRLEKTARTMIHVSGLHASGLYSFGAGASRTEAPAESPGFTPVTVDTGSPWDLCLDIRPQAGAQAYRAAMRVVRGTQNFAVDDAMVLVQGAIFLRDTVARLDDRGALSWLDALPRKGGLHVPHGDAYAFVHELVSLPRAPRLLLPDSLRLDDTRVAPNLILRLRTAPTADSVAPLNGDLLFEYDNHEVSWTDTSEKMLQRDPPRLLVRDALVERAAIDELMRMGVRVTYRLEDGLPQLELTSRLLPPLVRTLTTRGWRVEAENRRYRTATGSRFSVTSGIDWFELEGVLEFGDASISLAKLLAGCPRGESFIVLDDGTIGVIPEEWLARRELLELCDGRYDDKLRFTRGQAVLIDGLLAKQNAANVKVDEPFMRLREALRHFDGIDPADPPASFLGTLRGYQREGLGWLSYLLQFGFGGCLADDMGLGKTVQVLALLASRHQGASGDGTEATTQRPSLVVVPRSLIHNWQEEAARFVPGLRVLDHTGASRTRERGPLEAVDLVLTTYGTLMRDVAWLQHIPFECIVLDEAHAIKNASSETARAVRMLHGRNRLALTGTPVQNHLGELWSLFDFLNPGLLGPPTAFDRIRDPAGDPEGRRILAQTIRPFLLRRTKTQVAADLPPKVEQTIRCELDASEREFYDHLRAAYRQTILDRVDREGLAQSRMFILEGLLRLRQAACHPGLIDPSKNAESSAKIDMLVERLREIVEEGHKAIVFSQFVRLLDIARLRLDREGLAYASLDGRTRHRGTVVDQFQRDPSCRIFLVSLKAGGLGLNLTAAEYVFLLDPWWNPAIEAQAIDRAHRIGQTRQVFAYRLIAQDTIDEKVIELQQRKQQLADAVMGKSDELMQRLTRADLERLLS